MENTDFLFSEVQRLFDAEAYDTKGNPKTDYKACKDYVAKYIFPTMDGDYYVWEGSTQTFKPYSRENITHVFLDRFSKLGNRNVIREFLMHDISKTVYKVTSAVDKPRVDGNAIN